MRTPFFRIASVAAVATLPLTAIAQNNDNRYGTWAPPSDAAAETTNNGKSLKNLLKNLNQLIKDGEKAKAADPTFLRDLKKLTARYASPWTKVFVSDNFSDGNFDRAPRWSVTSGEFWVEKDYGLRARVTAPASSGGTSSQTLSKEKLALSILGAVLNGSNKNTTTTQPSAKVSRPSAIETRARVSNSFSVMLKFSSWKGDGTFAVALNQGIGDVGYRIVYATGANPALSLVKVTQSGRTVIGTKSVTALEDNNAHALAWTRTKDGTMTVKLDGKAILKGRDTSFRDGFDTLQLSSQGSDVIVKSVVLKGVR